ncbi:MAG: glycosyltransferase [Planctomycetota bacterium]
MPAPALAAILVTPDRPSNMTRTLAALRAQTARDRVQLVLVGPSRDAIAVPPKELAGFADVLQVIDPIERMGSAQAAGVRAATAPLVMFTEDHCYPEPGHVQAMLDLFAEHGCAAVGPTVVNANPASLVSRVQYLIEYGPYGEIGPKGTARQIPGHNATYQRDALLHYDNELDQWLEVETLMHWDMTDRGLVLINDPAPRSRHWNCSRVAPLLRFAWVFPRVFAAFRARRYGLLERLKLGLLWPLIAPIRFRRLLPYAVKLHGIPTTLAVSPLLFLTLLVSAASEGAGYLAGEGNHGPRATDFEFHRDRFFRRGETYDQLSATTPASADPSRTHDAVEATG